MKFADQLRFVLQNMKKNKSRLFMTVLATAMGCAFLIVLASVGFGLQKSIVDNIVGDRLVTAIDVYGLENKENNVNRQLSEEDVAYLRSVRNVKAVLFQHYINQPLHPTMENTPVDAGAVIALDFEAERIAGFALSSGRMPEGEAEALVSYHIRQAEVSAAGGEVPAAKEWLGKKLLLQVEHRVDGVLQRTPLEVTIVGVKQEPSREWQQERSIFVGLETLDRVEEITQTRLGQILPEESESADNQVLTLEDSRPYHGIQVIASGANHVKSIAEEIREKGYYNHSIANELEQVNLVFLIMKIGLIFVGTIAVLIASIGIFNTMTMAVTERAQDIGIMKAIGAHPSAIRKIFLLESSLIGIWGAVIGTLVSYVISIAVNLGLPMIIRRFMNERVPEEFVFSYIPGYLVVLACAISLGVALLSGARPAKRATRVDVLRALRRDI